MQVISLVDGYSVKTAMFPSFYYTVNSFYRWRFVQKACFSVRLSNIRPILWMKPSAEYASFCSVLFNFIRINRAFSGVSEADHKMMCMQGMNKKRLTPCIMQ